MSENTLIEAIKEKRRRAIERADKREARKFLRGSREYWINVGIIMVTVGSVMLAVTVLLYGASYNFSHFGGLLTIEKHYHTVEQTIVKPVEVNNITQVVEKTVKNEVVMKGTAEMTCIDDGSDYLKCYKNVRD